MEESLEKCLQISLLMLYNCFVETGMRLLVVMEKSFHCSAKHNPWDQISSLWTAETFNLFLMLSNSGHPKLSLFCSPCFISLSESNEINGFKIFTVYHQTFVFTGMILFVLSEALTVSYAFLKFYLFFFLWQSVCFLSLKWYDVIIL